MPTPIPAWVWPAWEYLGYEINNGLGVREVHRRLGISYGKARTLVKHVHESGPRPKRSGQRVHMVIPDPHAKPGQDLRRFKWLARMALAIQPDVIVCIGDWADNHSISRFDKGTIKGEGSRYLADISAANEALRVFHRIINDHNEQFPHAAFVPRFVFTVGNHEHRMDLYTNQRPELEGLLGMEALDFEKRGWEIVPFLVPVEIDGITYVHYAHSNMGRAWSGMYLAAKLTREWRRSVTVGHSHMFDYRVWRDRRTEQHGLVCGCYMEDSEDYAQQSNDRWWSGVLIKRDVEDGIYDLERWSIDRIRKTFGNEWD